MHIDKKSDEIPPPLAENIFLKRDLRHLNLARLISKKSPAPQFKVGAVIAKGNRILGVGHNNPYKSHPESTCYSRRIHAELAAILNVDNRNDLRDSTIYVFRGNRGIHISRPCEHCYALIQKYSIRTMVFTIENGYQKENVNV